MEDDALVLRQIVFETLLVDFYPPDWETAES
jgi:hypothetical protein